MVYRNRKIIILFGLLSVLFIAVKLFSAVILLKDDPTNFLILRSTPALDNQLVLDSIRNQNYLVLLSDENGFVGQSFYSFLVTILWWLFPLVTVAYALILKRRR